jgi:hypothetical protein
MQQEVRAIVGDAKTDVDVVNRIVSWIAKETRVVNTLPEFGYFHVKDNEIVWDRHLASEEEEARLLQSNFMAILCSKRGGTGPAVPLPRCRLRCCALPVCRRSSRRCRSSTASDPEPLVDRLRRRRAPTDTHGGLVVAAPTNGTEVWLGGRWVRVDREVGTGPMVGNKLFVRVFSADDWNNLYPERVPQDWDNENRDFRTLDVSDKDPRHKSRLASGAKLVVAQDALSVKQRDGKYVAAVLIRNVGTDRSPEFGVWFYAGDPAKGGRLLAKHAAGPILPSETWNEGTFPSN